MNDDDETLVFRVVVNHEEQYSIWLARKAIPAGWRDAGKQGTKADCLAYVEEVWTDMRPLSLRKTMASAASTADTAATDEPPAGTSGDAVATTGPAERHQPT